MLYILFEEPGCIPSMTSNLPTFIKCILKDLWLELTLLQPTMIEMQLVQQVQRLCQLVFLSKCKSMCVHVMYVFTLDMYVHRDFENKCFEGGAEFFFEIYGGGG